jgi:hypothetical protein
MTEQHVTADPHALLTTGEPLATVPELAGRLGCSTGALKELLRGPLYERVRFVRCTPGPWRYCVADVVQAFEPHRAAVEARRLRAAELEASDRAAKAARGAATEKRQVVRDAKKGPPKAKDVTPGKVATAAPTPIATTKPVQLTNGAGGPEVFVRRAKG